MVRLLTGFVVLSNSHPTEPEAQDSYWELETKTNKAGERIKGIRC